MLRSRPGLDIPEVDDAAVIAGGQDFAVGPEGQARDPVDVRQQRRRRPAGVRIPDPARVPGGGTAPDGRSKLAVATRWPSGLKVNACVARPAMCHRRTDRLPGGCLDQTGQAATVAQEGPVTIRAEGGLLEGSTRPIAARRDRRMPREASAVWTIEATSPGPTVQSLAAPSALAVRRVSPSGENAASRRKSRCRMGEPMGRPVAASQSRAVWSWLAVSTSRASGENDARVISPPWRSGGPSGRVADGVPDPRRTIDPIGEDQPAVGREDHSLDPTAMLGERADPAASGRIPELCRPIFASGRDPAAIGRKPGMNAGAMLERRPGELARGDVPEPRHAVGAAGQA